MYFFCVEFEEPGRLGDRTVSRGQFCLVRFLQPNVLRSPGHELPVITFPFRITQLLVPASRPVVGDSGSGIGKADSMDGVACLNPSRTHRFMKEASRPPKSRTLTFQNGRIFGWNRFRGQEKNENLVGNFTMQFNGGH